MRPAVRSPPVSVYVAEEFSADEADILAECERGEDSAVAEYKKAMEADLPASIRGTISRQYAAVKAAHDQIRGLRDAAKVTA